MFLLEARSDLEFAVAVFRAMDSCFACYLYHPSSIKQRRGLILGKKDLAMGNSGAATLMMQQPVHNIQTHLKRKGPRNV